MAVGLRLSSPEIAWSCASSKLAHGKRFSEPADDFTNATGVTYPPPQALGPPAFDRIMPPFGELSAMLYTSFILFSFSIQPN